MVVSNEERIYEFVELSKMARYVNDRVNSLGHFTEDITPSKYQAIQDRISVIKDKCEEVTRLVGVYLERYRKHSDYLYEQINADMENARKFADEQRLLRNSAMRLVEENKIERSKLEHERADVSILSAELDREIEEAVRKTEEAKAELAEMQRRNASAQLALNEANNLKAVAEKKRQELEVREQEVSGMYKSADMLRSEAKRKLYEANDINEEAKKLKADIENKVLSVTKREAEVEIKYRKAEGKLEEARHLMARAERQSYRAAEALRRHNLTNKAGIK